MNNLVNLIVILARSMTVIVSWGPLRMTQFFKVYLLGKGCTLGSLVCYVLLFIITRPLLVVCSVFHINPRNTNVTFFNHHNPFHSKYRMCNIV